MLFFKRNCMHEYADQLRNLCDITIVTISVPITTIYSFLSSKFRVHKEFYRFYPEDDELIHPKEAYILDMDGTRLTDTYDRWLTFLSDCTIFWGQVKYFEVVVEDIGKCKFIMIGMTPKKHYPAHSCLSQLRYSPSTSSTIQAGTRVGVLFDTKKGVAHLFIDGKYERKVFKINEWDNKDIPRYAVVSMACGSNRLRINNNAVIPRGNFDE